MTDQQTTDEPFNPLDPRLCIDPFPIFRRMREQDPVHFAEQLGMYVVTGHAAARQVLARRDGDTRWEQFQRLRHGDGVIDEPYFRILKDNVLMQKEEDHKRVRGTFRRNLTPPRIKELHPKIVDHAHGLIDAVADAGEMDLMPRFGSPLPLHAISTILDVPSEDEAQIHQWMHGFKLAIQMLPLSPEDLQFANDALSSLDEYFRALIAERREAPGDDLMSSMIADADDGLLTEDELVTNVWGLYVGAHDTTALSICNAAITLLEHPDALRLLLQTPALIGNTVDEILRYVTSVQGTHRLLPEALEVGGHVVPADTPIMVYLAGANHDESWCERAEQFDITREVPADHVSFGNGPHKCPGRHMARSMVGTAIEVLFTRLEGVRMTELAWDTSAPVFRGPAKLKLEWDRGLPRAATQSWSDR